MQHKHMQDQAGLQCKKLRQCLKQQYQLRLLLQTFNIAGPQTGQASDAGTQLSTNGTIQKQRNGDTDTECNIYFS